MLLTRNKGKENDFSLFSAINRFLTFMEKLSSEYQSLYRCELPNLTFTGCK